MTTKVSVRLVGMESDYVWYFETEAEAEEYCAKVAHDRRHMLKKLIKEEL